jgi:proteasome alpha subunit
LASPHTGQETGLAGTLGQAIDSAIRTWAVGSMAQNKEQLEENKEETKGSSKAGTTQSASADQDKDALLAHLRETAAEKTIEARGSGADPPVRPSIAPSNRHDLGRLLPKNAPTGCLSHHAQQDFRA